MQGGKARASQALICHLTLTNTLAACAQVGNFMGSGFAKIGNALAQQGD